MLKQILKTSAFTLIELLVVISIISLLSTVVFAVFSTGRLQAQDAAKKETVHNVQQALELYHTKHGVYPPNYSDDLSSTTRTAPAIQGSGSTSDAAYKKSMQVLADDGDLAAVPKSDSGAGYGYYNAGDTATFFTQLTGGYGNVTGGTIFPSSANFYANSLDQSQWPQTLRATLKSVNGYSCGDPWNNMYWIEGVAPAAYNSTDSSGGRLRIVRSSRNVLGDGTITWQVSELNLSSGPCRGGYIFLRANPGDNPLGYFYRDNNGTPDASLGVLRVDSL